MKWERKNIMSAPIGCMDGEIEWIWIIGDWMGSGVFGCVLAILGRENSSAESSGSSGTALGLWCVFGSVCVWDRGPSPQCVWRCQYCTVFARGVCCALLCPCGSFKYWILYP